METENRTELTGDTVSRAGSSVCELTNQRTSGYTGGGFTLKPVNLFLW